jgi:hypothetical protein
MFTVKGIYEHGLVRLVEPLPTDTPEPAEVTVTFTEAGTAAGLADATALEAFEGIVGLLSDLTPKELEKYDEAVRRRSPFIGPRLEDL